MSAIKTVNDAIKRLQDLVAEHPEAGEMPLYQQSCFDQPDTFQSSNLYLGQVFCPIIDDGTSSVINQRHCDPSKRYTSLSAVIIEAF